MIKVLVETTTINLSVDPPVLAVIPPVSLLVTSSDRLTINYLKSALADDMLSQLPLIFNYVKGSYITPGTLAWNGKLNGYSLHDNLIKDGKEVVTDASNGTLEFNVVTPAIMPGTPPTPDSTIKYTGKWMIVNVPQEKLTVGD